MKPTEEILVRYVQGIASTEEKVDVETWAQLNSENQQLVEDYLTIWKNADATCKYMPNMSKAWACISSKAFEQDQVNFLLIFRKVAAVLLFGAALSGIFFFVSQQSTPVEEWQSVDAETKTIFFSLPDETTVWLKNGATLAFMKDFEERKVKLTGNGYFQVIKTADEQPFEIQTDHVHIIVRGTDFFVNQQPKFTEIYVEDGHVDVNLQSEHVNTYTLTQGDLLRISEVSPPVKTYRDFPPNEFFWKTRTLKYEATPFAEVLSDLERNYGLKFKVKNTLLETCLITATFNDKSSQEILQTIQSILQIEIERSGRIYELSGKGCTEAIQG